MPRVVLIGPVTASKGKAPESGVAAYLEDLTRSLISASNQVTLLAQADAPVGRLGAALVRPTWSPSPAAGFHLSRALSRLEPDVVHLQHEFNLYGGQFPTALVTASVALCRLKGTPLVVTVHGVVDPNDVTPELLEHNYLPNHPRSVRAAFQIAYRFLGACSSRLIVHHRHFRDVLHESYGIPFSKITVIPLGHAVPETRQHSDRRGLQVLVLGFLTGYKEPEAVVDLAESDLLPNANFRFCVGRNPRIKSLEYAERYERLRARVTSIGTPRAEILGYVPEERLAHELRAADVLVLPYSQCLAASAVAGLALRYGVPVCFSSQLVPILGEGTGVFRLGDPGSLAAAITAVAAAGATSDSELFAPWSEVAAKTEAVWDSV